MSSKQDDAALAGPLVPPAGVRDFVYPESAALSSLTAKLVETFALYGYDLVVTPPFEHAEVIERALDASQRRDLLRFVDPQSGEVAALRSDITPQIARLVAANVDLRPGPWRLSYRGTVIRRRRGRARKHRQVTQAGVECIGIAERHADAEAILLCARACDAAGLTGYQIELNHVSVGRALLAGVPESLRASATGALAQKDVAELRKVLDAAPVADAAKKALLALPTLMGPAKDLPSLLAPLRGTAAEPFASEVVALIADLKSAGLDARISIDFGELRGMSYYTGASFAVLATGPGEPIASGGRYDTLLARFGIDAPATGFAIDVTNLLWALESAGHPWAAPRPLRVVVRGERAEDACAALRLRGIAAARVEKSDANAYARAWSYDAAAVAEGSQLEVTRADGKTRSTLWNIGANVDALASWLRSES